ncbi:GrpB family protein [Clostridium sp. FP2]|uniref:GrpB family protein n=1 Tax=Clostridium sp. FP2 TaxID=2724481 RepID=UPI0013E939F6|nr:GrpB family protein [Clostridium sp. FP2]MBZ9626098.1 GrpB family protein [Clostridium sp. FP2]
MSHCEEWKTEFEDAKKQLIKILGNNVVDVQHMGSTSINGIYAKPLLDIAVVLKSFAEMNVEGMKNAGYSYCGAQNEEKDRYLFVLRDEGQISLRHIHCYEPNNLDFYYVTHFRDYLNSHEEYAKEYSNLKRKLAEKYPDDRIAYTNEKEKFVKIIYQKIDAERVQ